MEESTPPTTSADPAPSAAVPTSVNSSPKNRRMVIILAVVIGILVVTTLVGLTTSLILLNQQKTAPTYQPAPISEQPATPSASLPSKYATNAGVLQIRDSLKNLMGKIDSVDLFEPEITPPHLDLHLNIPTQQ